MLNIRLSPTSDNRYLSFIPLITPCIALLLIFLNAQKLSSQTPSCRYSSIRIQKQTFIYPDLKTMACLFEQPLDSVWMKGLTPLGFKCVKIDNSSNFIQYEKQTGKYFQMVNFDVFFYIVSLRWQDNEGKVSMLRPILKKLDVMPIVKSVFDTYELVYGGRKYWLGFRSTIQSHGELVEDFTIEIAR